MNNRLRWLGHVARMPDERMPKRMLFGKLSTVRPQGGTKQRWKDGVLPELRFMGLEKEWASVAAQRDKWHAMTREAVTKWESEKNRKEKDAYEEKKAGIGVRCERCGKLFQNERGRRSHYGQVHEGVEETSSDGEADDKHTSTSSTACRTSSSSSSSSSSSRSSGRRVTRHNQFECPNCKKDCSSGSGLASHLRSRADCKAVAEKMKKKKKEKE